MTRKYNLLIVTSSLWIGGAEMVIRSLCHHLDKGRFNVSICHLKERGEIGDELHNDGYDITGIPKSTFFKTDYFTFSKLIKVILRNKIDIVHSHTPHALTDSVLSRLFLPRLKVVHTFHYGNYPHEKRSRMMLENIFSRMAHKLVAVGKNQERSIRKTYNLPGNRFVRIWNGVPRTIPAVDRDLRDRISAQGRIVIGTIGTLIEQKGITYLLEVASRLKNKGCNVLFVVAGDGPLRGELERKRLDLGLENTVLFIGWVKDAATRLLPLFDIFFQPSQWEAMSVVILEAMAAAKPIVATNVGENGYVIESERHGLIVEPANVDAMTTALERLVQDAGLRDFYGTQAQQMYEKCCTVEIMARKYEQLYLDTLSRK